MYDFSALVEAYTVEEAIRLLTEHPDTVIIAGGSDVLIKLREGKLRGCELVSIRKIDSLRGVLTEADGTLKILPLTSFSHITKDPLIQRIIPVLGEAVDQVGGPQIRNIGTIGGNISNGVTSADSASTLLAWDAEVEITGPDGVRTAAQQEILDAVKAAAPETPIVTIVTGGRPYILTWCDENTNAILEAYYPGQQGGIAIAETIFGENNPTGKTPLQFPRDMASVNDQSGDVSFDLENPLYDYGWGLSYE